MRVTRGIETKGNTSKNCKFTDEELSRLIILIGVKLSFYELGLSTHVRARVKRCLGLNTYLRRLAFS